MTGVTEALADDCCAIPDRVSEGDRAFARMRFEGIHRAPFLGLPRPDSGSTGPEPPSSP